MTSIPRILGPAARLWLAVLCRKSMPRVSGSIRLRGLNSAVEVTRDHFGVPHIRGGDAHDVLFAQGFVHAQDRLWQMEFQRALASGRLSEIVGAEALDADRWVRTIGIRRAAGRDEEALSGEARGEVEAYIEGVNSFIAAGNLPVELRVLGHAPGPWSAVDVLVWQKMVSWNLSLNWEGELLRAQLAERVGAGRAADLEPEWPEFSPVIARGVRGRGGLPASKHAGGSSPGGYRAFRRFMGPSATEGLGSNSWALSGARTETGLPILANDMHLPLHAPSMWYENHLECPEFHVTGVTFPGTPTIVAGHNGRVAWGFTNSGVDVQDLYMERLRVLPGKRVKYEFKGRWYDAVVLKEVIGVKGGPPVEEEVIITRHGPVINGGVFRLVGETPLALRWTSAEADSTTRAGYLIMRSRNCREFRDALRFWTSPCQNIVYADAEGNIAYTLGGRIPARKKGEGAVPVPGWTGAHEWRGFIPFEELPHLFNPPEGFIATANNKVTGDGYRYELGREFCMGDRAERIVELIAARPRIDPEYVKRIQTDQVSPTARRVGKYLAGFEGGGPGASRARAVMRGFEGELSADSASAALYEVFMRVFVRRALEGELGELTDRYMGKGPGTPLSMHGVFGFRAWEWTQKMLLADGRGRRAGTRGSREKSKEGGGGAGDDVRGMVAEALAEAVVFLEKKLGKNPGSWSWGRLHTLTFTHLFGRVKSFKMFFDRGAFGTGGDGNTIWAQFCGMHDFDLAVHIGPSFRFVADLADLDNASGVLAPGQSGIPVSPHYDDQIRDWMSGRCHRMTYRNEDVEKLAGKKLALLPG